MNFNDPLLRQIANYSPLDIMMADVAVRVQPTPTDYQTAVDHYAAINVWLDRTGSPLQGRVEEFYPQGSFAIGATIARHSSDSEFDIDVMAQINWPTNVDPEFALRTLHEAIASTRGTRYHDKAERKTRCSTVNYEGMHLDVTPTVRLWDRNDRTGLMFHSKPSDPSVPKHALYANPFGFAQWFAANTPADAAFGAFYERRSLEYNRVLMEFKADAAPVPDQMPVYRKSLAVIALQLIKRWRNLLYDRRYPNLRMPPSVLLAHYVALHANRSRSLADELIIQVDAMRAALRAADITGQLLYAHNVMCREDILTDRWPGNHANQRIFLKELDTFAADLRQLRDGGLSLAEMLRVLERLFGERPARGAYEDYIGQHVRDAGRSSSLHIPGRGAVPALGSLAAPATARATPAHTKFGEL
jgi:hypothetical protein